MLTITPMLNMIKQPPNAWCASRSAFGARVLDGLHLASVCSRARQAVKFTTISIFAAERKSIGVGQKHEHQLKRDICKTEKAYKPSRAEQVVHGGSSFWCVYSLFSFCGGGPKLCYSPISY